jgi:hypothetical protein
MNINEVLDTLQEVEGKGGEFARIRAEIKRQLYLYRDLQAECRQLCEELVKVEILMGAPAAPKMDGMPHGSSDPSSPTETLAIKHITLQDLYRKRVDALIAEQLSVEEMIGSLEPTERRLARYRYIDGLTWEEVCTCMNYSWRQTHRIHGKIIDKLTTAEIENRKASE